MTSQLEQILNYLDRDGVTEVIVAAGQPMQFRRAGALVSITAAQLTRIQVAALVANTSLAGVLGQRTVVEVQIGKRALRVTSSGTAETPALSISRQESREVGSRQESREVGSRQESREVGSRQEPARAPARPAPALPPANITERARRPSRLGRPIHDARSGTVPPKTAPAKPRTRGATKAPDPKPAEDQIAKPRTLSRATPMPDTITPELRGDTPAPANRLTKSDIKFRTPAPRPRDARESLPLDLDPTGAEVELDPPTLDLAARAGAPAALSLDLDDGDDLGIELGAPGSGHQDHRSASGAPRHHASHSDIDQAFDSLHAGSTPAIDQAFAGPRPTHAGSSKEIDRAFGGPSSPHPGSSTEIDRAFGGPRGAYAGSTPALDPAFGGPSRSHTGSSTEIDQAFGGPRGAGSTPARDPAFGGPSGSHTGSSTAIDQAFGGPRGVGSTPALDPAFGGPSPRTPAAPMIDLSSVGPRQGIAPIPEPLQLDELGPRVSSTAPAARYAPPPVAAQPLGASFAATMVAPPPIAARAAGVMTPALRALVQEATARGASDLHVIVERPMCARILGELVPLRAEVQSASEVEALVLPLLDDRGRAQLARIGYADLAIEGPGGGRLRTNISRCRGGLRATFRIARATPPTLDELSLPKDLAKVVAHHQGLVVIAGPSGHGKTTTLAALVDLINSVSAFHIITVEDPIEIIYPRKCAVVSQREVGAHTRSFAAALKGSLREDPDVIVIGELRDRETVEIALTAAETGHLVLATMSTPSAAKTIDRLVDMFPPADQQQVRASIAGALRAIVSQRLLPTASGDGVVAAVELVTGVLPLAAMIRDDKLFQLPSLMQRGRAFGMIRLDDSLAELVRAGRITTETALATSDSRKELAIRLSQGTAAIPVMGRK